MFVAKTDKEITFKVQATLTQTEYLKLKVVVDKLHKTMNGFLRSVINSKVEQEYNDE